MTSSVSTTTISSSASATAAVVAHPAERSLGGPSVTPAPSQATTSSKTRTVGTGCVAYLRRVLGLHHFTTQPAAAPVSSSTSAPVASVTAAAEPFVSPATAAPPALDFAVVAPPPPRSDARASDIDLRSPGAIAAAKQEHLNKRRQQQAASLRWYAEQLELLNADPHGWGSR